jgi:hypothetical protein
MFCVGRQAVAVYVDLVASMPRYLGGRDGVLLYPISNAYEAAGLPAINVSYIPKFIMAISHIVALTPWISPTQYKKSINETTL